MPRLLPPGYVPDLEGSLGVVLSAPSKLCACALAHSFQRLRTRINLLRTSILLNGHIVARELFHKYYKYWSFQEKCAQRPFAQTGYKKL